MVIMKDNTRPNNHYQPGNITPLNGHHVPDASFHLDGLSVPLSGEFSTADFDNFADPEADDLGYFFPPQGSLASNEIPGATVSPIRSSVDDTSAQEETANSGSLALVPADAELLPSAGFITPSKLAYYSRLAEAPRLDLDFIKAEARAGSADGESRVAAHHSQLCRMARAGLRHTLAEKHTSVGRNLQHLDEDITRTRILLGSTRQFDDVPGAEPALHWTWSDRLAATLWTGFGLSGLAMDFFTWATILRQNDPHFHHNPALALFFGAVPLCFPLSIKVLLGGMTDENGNDRLLRRVAWVGAAACLLTIGFFTLGHDAIGDASSVSFGHLAGGGSATSVQDWKPIAQKTSSMLLMVVAAIFSAISCHFLVGMFKRRRRAGRIANPQHVVTRRQLAKLQSIAHEERETFGAINGKMGELVAEEDALVGSAVNYYRELRSALTQAEQRLSELLQGPGGTPKLTLGSKLKKGGQALGLALAVMGLNLTGCSRNESVAAADAQTAVASAATKVVFGLSPRLNQAERDQVFQVAGDLALKALPAGGSLEVWDAYELHRICSFTIPADSFYSENPAARQKIAAGAMQDLKGYLTPASDAVKASPRILIPQFLEAISHEDHPGGMTVLLAGSAFYNHPRDPAWNLVDREGRALNAFPTDGHFNAEPEVSPFSTKGREQALTGVVLHMAYLHDEFPSEAQRQGLTRFYALWLKNQHGELATFTSDLGVALDNLRSGKHTPIMDPTPHADEDKPELREIRVERVQRARTTLAPGTSASVPVGAESILVPVSAAERSKTPPPSSFIVQNLSVGARWAAHVDIDVHAIHHPGAKALYFGCPQTEQGEFHKDFTDAPPGIQGFERVTFNQPTDLRQLVIGLNLYRGTAPDGVDVTVQICCDERRYERVFHLAASEGNRGENAAGRANDPHWLVISSAELAGMCGLR